MKLIKMNYYKNILIFTIIISIFTCTGCQKKDMQATDYSLKSGDVISADSPWFNATEIKFNGDYENLGNVIQLEFDLIGKIKNYIVLHSYGKYTKDSNNEVHEYEINDVIFIDKSSMQEISRTSLIEFNTQNSGIGKIMLYKEKVWVELYSSNSTGSILDLEYLVITPDNQTSIADKFENSLYIDSDWSCEVNEYLYYFLYNFDSSSYTMNVETPSGNVNDCNIAFKDKEIYAISSVFAVDNNCIILQIYTNTGYEYCLYNPESNILTNEKNKYDWFDNIEIKNMTVFPDGNVGITNRQSINKLDIENQCVSEIFNTSWTSKNITDLNYCSILDANENEITLLTVRPDGNPYFLNEIVYIYNFNRAETNPNAGKTVIELYCANNNVSDSIKDAISFYNSEPNDCFIVISERYNTKNYSETENIFEINHNLSEQLSIDIMAGNGPDIFIYDGILTELENNRCLIDLSDISIALSEDDYFINIINSSFTNENLYKIPLSFSIIGIQTDSANAGITSNGINLNDWNKFVNDYCNGNNPISYDQSTYLSLLFNNMHDVFINEDGVSLDCLDFQKLVEYCSNNVFAQDNSFDEYEYLIETDGTIPALFTVINGVSEYYVNIREIKNNGTSLIGLPSTDSRGPSCIPLSISISAESNNPNECKDFIKLLLSEEYQTTLTNETGNVINKSAFYKACMNSLEYYNNEVIFNCNSPDYRRLTQSDVDCYTEIIESISTQYCEGNIATMVINEEIPAYFNHQKSYDEVLAIITDRITTIIEEET